MRKRWSDLDQEEKEFLGQWGVPPVFQDANSAPCPEPELILAAEVGVLLEELSTRLKAHLASCVSCRSLVRDLTDAEISSPKPHEEARIRARVFSRRSGEVQERQGIWDWVWRPVPLAAAAALVIGAVVWTQLRAPAPQPQPQQEAVSRSSLPRAPVLPLEKLPVKLPLASTLVWRGVSDSEQHAFVEAFSRAVAPYREDNFPEAAKRLSQLAEKYPRAADVHLYLGICQLYQGQNAEAMRTLDTAREVARGTLAADVAWYRSVAYERSGEIERARATLQELCQAKTERSAQACRAWQELTDAR